MIEHSILPPSSAARRVACPGSRALEALYPEDMESQHAREGHAAHWVVSLKLNGWLVDLTGEAPNGEPITQEMEDGAKLYRDHIFSICKNPKELHVEERIDITRIHSKMWGTPDCWWYDSKKNVLHIWDYKYGFGFVEVFENWQLISYAAGIIDAIIFESADIDMLVKVNFHIVQPRSYHKDGQIRTWISSYPNLCSYWEILRGTTVKAMQPESHCSPNPECNYCRARHACPTLQQSALTAVDVSKTNSPFDLSSHQTGAELRYLKHAAELLDARISGLSEQALAMIRRGDRVPGFKVEQSYERDRWIKPINEILALGKMFEIDIAKPIEVVTPKQAVKFGLPEQLVKKYSEKPKGALKLVETQENESRKIFGEK